MQSSGRTLVLLALLEGTTALSSATSTRVGPTTTHSGHRHRHHQSTHTPRRQPHPTCAAASDDDKPERAASTTNNPLAIVKEAGLAGALSYTVVELSFFTIALPTGYLAYHAINGVWLDLGVLLAGGEGRTELLALLLGYIVLLKTLFPLRLGATLFLLPRMRALLNDEE